MAASFDLSPIEEWQDQAACRGYPTAWWYAGQTETGQIEHRRALAICAGCDVKGQCLESSLRLPPNQREHGIWAGYGPKARRRILAARRNRERVAS